MKERIVMNNWHHVNILHLIHEVLFPYIHNIMGEYALIGVVVIIMMMMVIMQKKKLIKKSIEKEA